jgi:serine/threonine-protein kinase
MSPSLTGALLSGKRRIALHANQVIHRDLKPENVMADERTSPRIADFGFSRFISVEAALAMTGEIGRPLYAAPDRCDESQHGTAADVYAYAVLVFQQCTAEMPFAGMGNHGRQAAGHPGVGGSAVCGARVRMLDA